MSTVTTQSTAYAIASTLFGTSSPVTGSAPSDASDGLSMRGLSQVTVYLSVGSGVTLSGTGTLLAYEWVQPLQRWARNPGCDIPLASFSSIAIRDITAGVFTTAQFNSSKSNSEASRIQFVPSSVAFSTGSGGCTVTLVGTKEVMAGTGQL